MSRYKKSLQIMLDKYSVGVLDYLRVNELKPTEENIAAYYKSIKKTVNKNAITKMTKYLESTSNF